MTTANTEHALQLQGVEVREDCTVNVYTLAPEWIERLIERETHSDTMRSLSPLECQWLEDWRAHFEPGTN